MKEVDPNFVMATSISCKPLFTQPRCLRSFFQQVPRVAPLSRDISMPQMVSVFATFFRVARRPIIDAMSQYLKPSSTASHTRGWVHTIQPNCSPHRERSSKPHRSHPCPRPCRLTGMTRTPECLPFPCRRQETCFIRNRTRYNL